jgi:uridylate kinase
MKSKNERGTLNYNRVLLKLSGEALAGEKKFGIEPQKLKWIAEQIADAASLGARMAVVIGGGNFFRGGREGWGIHDRVSVDYLGMLATVMNSVALQESLVQHDLEVRVLSAIDVPQICEPFIRPRALMHLKKNRIVILAAGTGNPFFSTDTAAALRALELGCEAIFKATKVKGVYDSDPEKNPRAKFCRRMSFTEALSRDLKVMDATALSLCRDHHLPVLVFNLFARGCLRQALLGKEIGTLIQ